MAELLVDGCRITENPEKTNEFIIFTKQGISYPIMAATVESKNEWIIQINNVRRCHEMKDRASQQIQGAMYGRIEIGLISRFHSSSSSSSSSSPSLDDGCLDARMNIVGSE